ncbi:MAG: MarR family transcriptional regulator [Anaerolineales bacterium]|nr:MarR family transcriptional regulator [Anaerolineales bacterium]
MAASLQENNPLETDVEAIEHVMLQLGWATHRQLHQELAEFNLTVSQFAAMRALQGFDEGSTMSELAEAARQISATMTGIVDRLVESEIVTRQRDPGDRRTLRVSLTEKGVGLLEKVKEKKRVQLRQFLEGISPTERKIFVRVIGKYLDVVYG